MWVSGHTGVLCFSGGRFEFHLLDSYKKAMSKGHPP
jgi:hypothetical protein